VLQNPLLFVGTNNSSRWARAAQRSRMRRLMVVDGVREPIELRCGRGGFDSGFIPADREPSLTTVSALLREQQTSTA
jgi:hypothetical protein